MAKNPFYADKIVLRSGVTGNGIYLDDGTTVVDKDGNVDSPITTSNLTTTGNTTLGDSSADTLTVPSTSQFNAPVTVGVDDTGYDVKFFGATASSYWLWDESADSVILVGGTTQTGNYQLTGTLTVGVDDTGHDVKFFGATAGAYMLWDESADELIFSAGASIDLTTEVVMIDFKDGDASAIDPSATAESGWININVDGVKKYIPYYAAA